MFSAPGPKITNDEAAAVASHPLTPRASHDGPQHHGARQVQRDHQRLVGHVAPQTEPLPHHEVHQLGNGDPVGAAVGGHQVGPPPAPVRQEHEVVTEEPVVVTQPEQDHRPGDHHVPDEHPRGPAVVGRDRKPSGRCPPCPSTSFCRDRVRVWHASAARSAVGQSRFRDRRHTRWGTGGWSLDTCVVGRAVASGRAHRVHRLLGGLGARRGPPGWLPVVLPRRLGLPHGAPARLRRRRVPRATTATGSRSRSSSTGSSTASSGYGRTCPTSWSPSRRTSRWWCWCGCCCAAAASARGSRPAPPRCSCSSAPVARTSCRRSRSSSPPAWPSRWPSCWWPITRAETGAAMPCALLLGLFAIMSSGVAAPGGRRHGRGPARAPRMATCRGADRSAGCHLPALAAALPRPEHTRGAGTGCPDGAPLGVERDRRGPSSSSDSTWSSRCSWWRSWWSAWPWPCGRRPGRWMRVERSMPGPTDRLGPGSVGGSPATWRRWPCPLALLAAAVLFSALTALGRWIFGIESARTSRYLYIYVALMLPAFGVAAQALVSRTRVMGPVVGLLLVGIITMNVSTGSFDRRQREFVQRGRLPSAGGPVHHGGAHARGSRGAAGRAPLPVFVGPISPAAGFLVQALEDGKLDASTRPITPAEAGEFRVRLGLAQRDEEPRAGECTLPVVPEPTIYPKGTRFWATAPILARLSDEKGNPVGPAVLVPTLCRPQPHRGAPRPPAAPDHRRRRSLPAVRGRLSGSGAAGQPTRRR